MATRGARNNILAGAFVLAALLLGVWVSFKLSGRPSMGGLRRFIVRFSLEDGATGLKDGSPVLLAGQQIGQVKKVEFAKTAEGLPSTVDVRVEIRADMVIYENAGVYLQLPLLGTLSSINITSVGTATEPHQGASATIEDDEVVKGRIAPPAFLAQAGFGSDQAAQLRTTIDRVQKLIENAGPKLEASANDAQALLANLRTRLEEWSRQIDKTAANIEQASGRLDPLLTKAEGTLDEARAAIKDIREVVASNREKLGQIIDRVASAVDKIDQQTIDQINAAIKEGRDALGALSEAVGKASVLLTEETPGIRRTLANLRLMSDQLKLTAVEVRSQPWRLLHSPTTKEMSSQVLYDATRAYAEAASDLRAASEALEASGGKPSDEAMQMLSRAVDKYKAAEAALMDRLIENDRK